MEYNYELLRKCHGLRFRATIADKPQEGIIKVTSEGVVLCYGEEDPGYLVTFGRRNTFSFSKETSAILPSDFEIVPRDPDTYQDWQVGDVIRGCEDKEIIFRSGEVVVFKYTNYKASTNFTCSELFRRGYRLVLTDIEQQIIEERKKFEPQDGEVCYLRGNYKWIFIRKGGSWCSDMYAALDLERGGLYYNNRITIELPKELRPATEDEKRMLFDAMAKERKRWNAEKKVVEDIKPVNEDTEKLIGTTGKYEG